jgi:hypothetical protein
VTWVCGVILGINAVYRHLGTSKWYGFLPGNATIHSERCHRVRILKGSVYPACKHIGTMGKYTAIRTLWYLNPALNSLQLGLYDIFRNVSMPSWTKIYVVSTSLYVYRQHWFSKCPANPCHWIYIISATFFSITNLPCISRVYLSNFYVNGVRTDWDFGNSLKISQNRKFPFAPSVLPIAVNSAICAPAPLQRLFIASKLGFGRSAGARSAPARSCLSLYKIEPVRTPLLSCNNSVCSSSALQKQHSQ